MHKLKLKTKYQKAYSLVETMVVITIAALVIMAALKIHAQVRKAAAAVSQRIDNDAIPTNVLQRIAEDIDRLTSSETEMQFIIDNKLEKDINKSQLIINSYYYDNNAKKQLYEQIIWRSYYDEFDGTTYLYRSHGGIAVEDNILDVLGDEEYPSQIELQEQKLEQFIPVCSGITFFEFTIPQGPENDPLYKWPGTKVPGAITVTISFAEPIEDVFGDYMIPYEKIYSRTITIDRTRKLKFQFVRTEFTHEDPNDVSADPNSMDNNTLEENTEEVMETIKNTDSKE